MRVFEEFHYERKIGQAVVASLLLLGISLSVSAATANEFEGDSSHTETYESRFFGTVEKTPPGNIGTWVVSKRKIVVTSETKISERHGKAGPGAYVEVEGANTGKAFAAHTIKVKRSKQK